MASTARFASFTENVKQNQDIQSYLAVSVVALNASCKCTASEILQKVYTYVQLKRFVF